MEERLCLTDKMLESLAFLKGKNLKYYQADLRGRNNGTVDGVVILQTGSIRVPIIRVLESINLFGEEDERAPLECISGESGGNYKHPYPECARDYLVGERISSVAVVRDRATWIEDGGEDTLVEDTGILIQMSRHALGLSCYMFEDIAVKFVDLADAESAVMSIGDYWGEESDTFHVEREMIEL